MAVYHSKNKAETEYDEIERMYSANSFQADTKLRIHPNFNLKFIQ